MNRRSFFRLGFGAALSPVADKWLSVLPLAAPVQKMDYAAAMERFHDINMELIKLHGVTVVF